MRILIPIILSIMLTGCIASEPEQVRVKPKAGTEVNLNVTPSLVFEDGKIDKKALAKGCQKVDCITSISSPKFISANEAAEWLNPEDIIFGLNLDGVQRAYPQKILNWHEIVNDKINNQAVLITFSPLSGTSAAYKRVVDEIITDFGVSGHLYNSNLLMYDHYEGNIWQQINGEALNGPAAERNEQLSKLEISSSTWEDWQSAYPESEVLSSDTGFNINYQIYPYQDYQSSTDIYYPLANFSDQIDSKAVVYGVEVDGSNKAYTLEALEREETIEDQNIKITLEKSGLVTAINLENNEKIHAQRAFWFAWFAFHPNTELYQ